MRITFDGPMPEPKQWRGFVEGAWNLGYVYMLFAEDTLLYVGMTSSIKNRWDAHHVKKEWWDNLTHAIVFEVHGKDYWTARAKTRNLERVLIYSMLPTKNMTGPASLPSKRVA